MVQAPERDEDENEDRDDLKALEAQEAGKGSTMQLASIS